MDLQDSNTFYEQISLKVDFLFFAVFSWWLLFLVSAMKRTELLHPTIFSACCLFKAIYSNIPRAVESNNGFVLSSQQLCVCFSTSLLIYLIGENSEKNYWKTEFCLLWQTTKSENKNISVSATHLLPHFLTLDLSAKFKGFNLKVVFP